MGPWKPFKLIELPVDEVTDEHVRACGVCSWKRYWSAVAMHEATHLAVALELGLGVEFCSIDGSKEIEVTELEAALYPLVAPGTKIPAVATRLVESELERAPRHVLVAMAAPSCIVTGDESMDTYATIEAAIATRVAKTKGFDPDEILDRAKRLVERTEVYVLRYAGRLAQEGRIQIQQ